MAHERFESCIQACNDCADACNHCAVACLREPNVKQLARCIQLDIDCAAVCRLAADVMARGGELAGVICEACAQACDACAEECAQHTKMPHCQECADACHRCAEECRRIVSSVPPPRVGEGAHAAAH
jgi:hypothetical protein